MELPLLYGVAHINAQWVMDKNKSPDAFTPIQWTNLLLPHLYISKVEAQNIVLTQLKYFVMNFLHNISDSEVEKALNLAEQKKNNNNNKFQETFNFHKNGLLNFHMEVNKMVRVSDNKAEVVVIGGMVLDINATPSMVAANPRTTTPGKVLYALGGVARNVAECTFKLGAEPYMISAIGFDVAGSLLLEHWIAAGLSVEGIKRTKDIETAVVSNIFDVKGELAAAVASVESIEKFLTPEWIQNFKFNICSAPVLMVDANLSPPALVAACRLAAECRTPVWFEPVSVIKSKRVASIAKYITYTSPNEDELVAMANALSCRNRFLPIQRDSGSVKFSIEKLFQMLMPPTWVLLEKGIRVVIVTLGPHGVFLCFKATDGVEKYNSMKKRTSPMSRKLYEAISLSCPPSRIIGTPKSKGSHNIAVHFPALPASVVRLVGAGDCLVGGAIASISAGLDIMQSVAVGIAAAKGAVESESNVPAEYDLARIADDARTVYSQAKVLFCESKL